MVTKIKLSILVLCINFNLALAAIPSQDQVQKQDDQTGCPSLEVNFFEKTPLDETSIEKPKGLEDIIKTAFQLVLGTGSCKGTLGKFSKLSVLVTSEKSITTIRETMGKEHLKNIELSPVPYLMYSYTLQEKDSNPPLYIRGFTLSSTLISDFGLLLYAVMHELQNTFIETEPEFIGALKEGNPGRIKTLVNVVSTDRLELINKHFLLLTSDQTIDPYTYKVFKKYGIDTQKVIKRLQELIAENKKFIETLKMKKQ